jgi:hypothetical protein
MSLLCLVTDAYRQDNYYSYGLTGARRDKCSQEGGVKLEMQQGRKERAQWETSTIIYKREVSSKSEISELANG